MRWTLRGIRSECSGRPGTAAFIGWCRRSMLSSRCMRLVCLLNVAQRTWALVDARIFFQMKQCWCKMCRFFMLVVSLDCHGFNIYSSAVKIWMNLEHSCTNSPWNFSHSSSQHIPLYPFYASNWQHPLTSIIVIIFAVVFIVARYLAVVFGAGKTVRGRCLCLWVGWRGGGGAGAGDRFAIIGCIIVVNFFGLLDVLTIPRSFTDNNKREGKHTVSCFQINVTFVVTLLRLLLWRLQLLRARRSWTSFIPHRFPAIPLKVLGVASGLLSRWHVRPYAVSGHARREAHPVLRVLHGFPHGLVDMGLIKDNAFCPWLCVWVVVIRSFDSLCQC